MRDWTVLKSLFVDYASGAISAEQLHELEAALREDSNLRREFMEYLNIDAALGDLAALSGAEAAAMEQESNALASDDAESMVVADVRPSHAYRIVTIVGAVAATLFIAAILWFANPGDDEVASVATLVTDVDAVLLCEGKPWSSNELRAGEYRLDRGLLHLQFSGNVMVYVEAPARFDAVSGNRVRLHDGRLSANVPPEGIGFTVETREAEIIDFGTEFSVDVESGTSEVHVFEGLVRVQPIAAKDGKVGEAIDLRTSQAVQIRNVTEKPVEIELASHRFIRNFDESRLIYFRAARRLFPLVHYRMPIRDLGLVSSPPEYSGVVLTGDGKRPPHARGVFVGGSLRVGVDSTGRGGRVDTPPALSTGQFSLTVFVYLEAPPQAAVIVTNLDAERGNFGLSLDENGVLQASIRSGDGDVSSIAGGSVLPLKTWRYFVVTVDGKQMKLFEDGELIASRPCGPLAVSDSDTVWFGTAPNATQVWDGRIDEVALFDRALTEEEVAMLYLTAQEEIATLK